MSPAAVAVPTSGALDAARQRIIDAAGALLNPFDGSHSAPFAATPEQDDLAAAHAYCAELTRREAGNFFHSFKYLPHDQRQAIYTVYAFCRRADDIVDGDHDEPLPADWVHTDPDFVAYRTEVEARHRDTSPVLKEAAYLDRLAQLFHFTERMRSCYGSETWLQDPIFLALKSTIGRFGIREEDAREFLRGMEDDLFVAHYETFEDLRTYCYRVASVVGLMTIEVYGHRGQDDEASFERIREQAIAQGLFMQLTNILRDVKEDAERGRCYLPLDELAAHGIEPSHLTGAVLENPRWTEFVDAYCGRIRSYLPDTMALLPNLPKRARYSPAALTAIYERILQVIEKRRGDVFTRRASLSTTQKVVLAARIFLRYRVFGRA